MARILVVDDTDVQREVVMSMLRDAGHEVEGAVSQEDAIAKATPDFDLFVIDIMLRISNTDREDAKTLGGVEVIKHLRHNAATKNKPIVALTKRGDKSDVMPHLEPWQISGYIEIKGTPEHEILQIIHDALQYTR